MTKAVDEGRAERFVLYYFIPSDEGEVRRGDGCLLPGPERQMVEELFTSFLVQRDVSELITDDQVIVQEAFLQALQFALCLRLADIRKKMRDGGEVHAEAL